MALLKYKVIYADREVEVIATPRAQVMAEERYGGINESNGLRSTYFIAWHSLFKAGKESDDFDTWLDKIVDVESVDEKPANPTSGDDRKPAGSSPSAR